ncbi:MAG TPA: hypothetical protein VFE85_02490 [Woeseiaceae bacterium]|nr:hypothetical protein [Woeseiaceae bacterium]
MNTIDIDTFIHNQRRRDFWNTGLLLIFSMVFLGSVTVAGSALGKSPSLIDIVLPAGLTAMSGIVLFRQWRVLMTTRHHYRDMSLPTATALQRLCESTTRRLREARLLMAAVLFGMVPVFVLAAAQQVANGKMSVGDAASFLLLVSVATLTVLGVMRHRIRNQLEPQLASLTALQEQMD